MEHSDQKKKTLPYMPLPKWTGAKTRTELRKDPHLKNINDIKGRYDEAEKRETAWVMAAEDVKTAFVMGTAFFISGSGSTNGRWADLQFVYKAALARLTVGVAGQSAVQHPSGQGAVLPPSGQAAVQHPSGQGAVLPPVQGGAAPNHAGPSHQGARETTAAPSPMTTQEAPKAAAAAGDVENLNGPAPR